jgi:NMD protein affecting ribosome stability and mRNA decay
MLMGYIGKTLQQKELPPLRVGDVVEVQDLVLSDIAGGNWALNNKVTGNPIDYRSNLFSRQLHGKIKRTSTPV